MDHPDAGEAAERLREELASSLVCLFLFTGSVLLPAKTFFMNALTVGATFGVLVWIFRDGRLEGLLDYTSQDAAVLP